MTYKTDPARWTHSMDDAPDVLRAPFAAARGEGPSDMQMRALAVKLAALSAGTAAAATAATAKAASTTASGTAAAASAGGLSAAKLAVSIALFGATITGAVVFQGKVTRNHGASSSPAALVESTNAAEQALSPQLGNQPGALGPVASPAPVGQAQGADVQALPSVTSLAEGEHLQTSEPSAVQLEANQVAGSESARSSSARGSRGTRSSVRGRTVTSSSAATGVGEAASSTAAASSNAASAATELSLLQRARAVLASRPREAFILTQQHREKYPSGMFAQERDALAVEAMMRAGEMGTARSLAERFLRAYPSSPHAHRFRESMGLR